MYNRKLIRLAGFDYSASRYYFITICVQNHAIVFGRIEDKSVHLSANGKIATKQWSWLGRQYPYIDLVSFVVMPNHVHGIIYINQDYYNVCYRRGGGFNNSVDDDTNAVGGRGFDDAVGGRGFDDVGNGRDHSLQRKCVPYGSQNQIIKIKPLPELIGAYKTTVSKRIHQKGDMEFKWQKSYHDHIVRNFRSLKRVINYIEKNPENWNGDAFYR